MTILKNSDGSFYPAGFFDFSGPNGGRGYLVLVADIAALSEVLDMDEFMQRVPQHDPSEFRQWCADRRLSVTGVTQDINEGEEVHFGFDQIARFDFLLRWNA